MKTKKVEFFVFQSIKTEIWEWIQTGIWKPKSLISGKEALAKQFGCVRQIVNRVLRELAEERKLNIRRKVGIWVITPKDVL